MFKLLQIVDGNVVAEHALTETALTIGRNPGNALQPDDPSVSGQHACIRLTPSAYLDDSMEATIEDQGSTNGTWVNDKSIRRHLLKHGDRLTIGTLNFKFIDEQALALGGTRILLQEDS
jgi:pSer/pThr/pTyr-binding forkhead associated (FHA) protein